MTIGICIIYRILLIVPQFFKFYKLYIIFIVLLLSVYLLVYRIIINNKHHYIEQQINNNVYDLKDFIKKKHITISNEYPILLAEKDVDYDLCDRTVIINQLYSSLKACYGLNSSFVIGLEGPWGSGKTTIINNVIGKIKNESPNDYIITNDFDPWVYSTQQALLTALFDRILINTGIKCSNSSLKSISNSLIKSIMGNNVAANIAGNIIFYNDAETEIEKLKEQICSYLENNVR